MIRKQLKKAMALGLSGFLAFSSVPVAGLAGALAVSVSLPQMTALAAAAAPSAARDVGTTGTTANGTNAIGQTITVGVPSTGSTSESDVDVQLTATIVTPATSTTHGTVSITDTASLASEEQMCIPNTIKATISLTDYTYDVVSVNLGSANSDLTDIYAFGCTSLTSIDVSKIATCKSVVLTGDTKLESVTLGGATTQAFVESGCTSLKSLSVPATATTSFDFSSQNIVSLDASKVTLAANGLTLTAANKLATLELGSQSALNELALPGSTGAEKITVRGSMVRGATGFVVSANNTSKTVDLSGLTIGTTSGTNKGIVTIDNNSAVTGLTLPGADYLTVTNNGTTLTSLSDSDTARLDLTLADTGASIKSLNVTGDTGLTGLTVTASKLETLSGLKKATGLTSLVLTDVDSLESLDVANMSKLATLTVTTAAKLESLSASKCDFVSNLTFVNAPKLKTLDVSDNAKMTTLDVTMLSGLEELDASGIIATGAAKTGAGLAIGNANLKKLDLSDNSALISVDAVTSTSCPKLEEVNVSGCDKLTTLKTVQTNAEGTAANPVNTKIDITGAGALATLSVNEGLKYPKYHSVTFKTTAGGAFSSSPNFRTYTALTALTVNSAQLQGIVMPNANMTNVDLAYNWLTAFDSGAMQSSGNVDLDLSNNYISELNVTGIKAATVGSGSDLKYNLLSADKITGDAQDVADLKKVLGTQQSPAKNPQITAEGEVAADGSKYYVKVNGSGYLKAEATFTGIPSEIADEVEDGIASVTSWDFKNEHATVSSGTITTTSSQNTTDANLVDIKVTANASVQGLPAATSSYDDVTVYMGGGNSTMTLRTADVYIITYEANGGDFDGDLTNGKTVSTKTQAVLKSSTSVTAATDDATGLVKLGYSLNDWCTDETGVGGKRYTPGASITLTDDITLYGDWEARNYNVSFKKTAAPGNMIGATISGAINNISVSSDSETPVDLSENYTADGYDFLGWQVEGYDTSDNNMVVLDEDSYTISEILTYVMNVKGQVPSTTISLYPVFSKSDKNLEITGASSIKVGKTATITIKSDNATSAVIKTGLNDKAIATRVDGTAANGELKTKISALREGKIRLWAYDTTSGNALAAYKDIDIVTTDIEAPTAEIDPEELNMSVDEEATIEVKPANYEQKPSVSFKSSDTDIAVVEKDTDTGFTGTVIGKGEGTATITATVSGWTDLSGNAAPAVEKTMTVNVSAKTKDIADESIVAEVIEDKVYTGAAIEPEVSLKDGEKELVKDTDYEVAYENNTNAGEASVIITGKGDYTGTRAVAFKINPASIEQAIVNVPSVTYNGQSQAPAASDITVKIGENVLTADDYDITKNEGGTNAGTYPVEITGKGNYAGTKTGEFVINPASIEAATVSIDDLTYNGTNQAPSAADIIVKVGETGLTDTDYEITKNDGGTNAGIYTVEIAGHGNYTGTKTQEYSINKLSIAKGASATFAAKTYNGKSQTFKPSAVKAGKLAVTYTIKGNTRTNAGTGTATITGTGNFTGSFKAAYTMNKAKVSSVKVTLASAKKTYTGKNITNSIKTAKLGTVNVKSQLKIKSYKNNKNVGTATAVVALGKGSNFTGTKNVTFKIVKAANTMTAKGKTAKASAKTLKKKAVTIKASKAFTVKNAKGKVTYTKKSGNKNLTVASNGVVTVKKGTEAGSYTMKVTVKAAGNKNYKAKSQVVTVKVQVK